MRRDAGQFAADNPDVLAARRQLLVDSQKFLHRQRVGDVVGQRRQVIQPVGVGDELGVGHVLGDLFVAAMQITHLRNGFGDHFAVQFEDDAQHAVGGGVRWSHVQDHFLALHVLQLLRCLLQCLGRLRRSRGRFPELHLLASRHQRPPFFRALRRTELSQSTWFLMQEPVVLVPLGGLIFSVRPGLARKHGRGFL